MGIYVENSIPGLHAKLDALVIDEHELLLKRAMILHPKESDEYKIASQAAYEKRIAMQIFTQNIKREYDELSKMIFNTEKEIRDLARTRLVEHPEFYGDMQTRLKNKISHIESIIRDMESSLVNAIKIIESRLSSLRSETSKRETEMKKAGVSPENLGLFQRLMNFGIISKR